MRVEAGGDESPHLVKDIGKSDQEGHHQRHLHRHQKDADDIGGDHLPALRQRGQQRLRQQCVEFLCPGEQADEDHPDRDERPDQPVTQLDEVGKE